MNLHTLALLSAGATRPVPFHADSPGAGGRPAGQAPQRGKIDDSGDEDPLESGRALLGLRPVVVNDDVIPGPFTYLATFPDNVTTPFDLKLAANITDPKLLQLFGSTSNPDFIMQIDAVLAEWDFDTNSETRAVAYAAMRSAILYYKDSRREIVEPLYHASGTIWDSNAAATTAAATTIERFSREAAVYRLPIPLMVNLRDSTNFDFRPNVAVNTAAAIPVVLTLFGAIWKTDLKTPKPLRCYKVGTANAVRKVTAGLEMQSPTVPMRSRTNPRS